MPLITNCTCNSRPLTFCGKTLFSSTGHYFNEWISCRIWQYWQCLRLYSNALLWFWIDFILLLYCQASRALEKWVCICICSHFTRYWDFYESSRIQISCRNHSYCRPMYRAVHKRNSKNWLQGLQIPLYFYGLHRSYLSRWGDNKSIFCSAIEDVTISYAWLRCTKLCIPGRGDFSV